ncbi:MAG TPA: response regulator transcription factor [Bryobacteraceae bacterium]|jgi:DNA-binding NarL/FixJ family response regulator|nr:response regulator transcription factor [Bryobacteraceae bacterium]
MPVRVLIADDHPLIRSGLRTLLEREGEFEVIGEAADGYEAIELATALKPDIAMLDVSMPRLNGIDTAQHISQRIPRTRILLVSMHSDEAYILRALKSGARGYLLKASPELDVLRAVRAVAAGNAYFSPEVTKLLVEDYVRQLQQRGATDSYDLLSIREKEILQLLVSGKSNREIADLLHISVSTVETHRTNILTKLGLHNLPELILYAVRKGLLS